MRESEFNANGDVVVVLKAAFAKPNGKRGLASARVANGDDFGNVVPRWLRHLAPCVLRLIRVTSMQRFKV